MNPETLRVPFVEVQASVLEELQRKAAAYDATNAELQKEVERLAEALSQVKKQALLEAVLVARKYSNALDDVPALIAIELRKLAEE